VGDEEVPNPNAVWPNLAGPADENAPNPPDKLLDPKFDDVCANDEFDEV